MAAVVLLRHVVPLLSDKTIIDVLQVCTIGPYPTLMLPFIPFQIYHQACMNFQPIGLDVQFWDKHTVQTQIRLSRALPIIKACIGKSTPSDCKIKKK